MEKKLNKVIVIYGIDGYRSLFSFGELFLRPEGKRIIIADTINGQPIKRGGKLMLVCPDDIFADRIVKAISKIEIKTLEE